VEVSIHLAVELVALVLVALQVQVVAELVLVLA
jgi:hypothetical protein